MGDGFECLLLQQPDQSYFMSWNCIFFHIVSWNIHLTTKCWALVPLTGVGPGNTWHCAGSSAVWLLNRHYVFITLAVFHGHSFSLPVSGFGLIFASGLTALASPLGAVSCTPEMLMHVNTAPKTRENSFWAVWVSLQIDGWGGSSAINDRYFPCWLFSFDSTSEILLMKDIY